MTVVSLSEEDIFQIARRIEVAEARQAYLDQVCQDNAPLREQVDVLLACFNSSAGFLESPSPEIASVLPTRDQSITEQRGDSIGPYKLLDQIGEGGFGVVFLAEQEKPVRRRVALKVVKPGMDTRDVVARFEAERQALALMDHPNIARVYEAGATDSGRPYFVMELIQGVPITEYCDQCRLATKNRLELFVAVCQAVQHAHQKGIIHRDLKPNNVLVAMQDGNVTPKVIDFGVAKAIGKQTLTERTPTTAFAQMVGTPMYMSPEQAELSPLGVDTRSDIYSLGVMLYELLAGATPFDKDRLHAASYDELRRIIREEEPPRPSTRLSTLAADLASTVAERRRTDARRLSQTVRGELDWIVMKCLEKDRSRRYDSAGSLARDVERYLADEPVQACPPSAGYRLKKLVRRNKLAASFLALMLVGIAGLIIGNVTIAKERDAKAKALAQATRESAIARAISDLLQRMLASSNPDHIQGSQYTLRELLDDVATGLGDELASQPEVEAAVRSVIGNSYWRLGAYERAELHLKKTLDIRRRELSAGDPRVADSLVDYAWSLAEQDRHEAAERHVRQALAIYRQQKSESPKIVRAMWSLQQFLMRQSRLAEAERCASEALALTGDERASQIAELPNILHGLAEAKITEGKHEEAEQWARRAVDGHRRLHSDRHPETAYALWNLGRALQGQRKHADAAPPLREALAIFRHYYAPDHSVRQHVTRDLLTVLQATADHAAAAALLMEETRQTAPADAPDDQVRIAELLLIGSPTDQHKQEARRLIWRAIEGYGQAAKDAPDDLEGRISVLLGYAKIIGSCVASPGFEGEVDELNRRLAADLPTLLAAFPNSRECPWQTAFIYRSWAYQLYPHNEYLPTVERAYLATVEIFEKLATLDADRPGLWLYQFDSYVVLGNIRWRLGRPDDAAAAFDRAIAIHNQHAATMAADPAYQAALGIAINAACLAYRLELLDRRNEAGEFLEQAELAAARLKRPTDIAVALAGIGVVQLRLGDVVGHQETCRSLAQTSSTSANEHARVQQLLTWILAPDALEDPALIVARAEDLAADNSLNCPHFVHFLLGAAYYRQGEYAQAVDSLEQSIAAYPSDRSPLFVTVNGFRLGLETINAQRLMLAMSLWQLDRKEDARQSLAQTVTAIKEELKTPTAFFGVRVIVEILRNEAEYLIEQNPAARPLSGTTTAPPNSES
jgi:serine/threonine protein kinase